MRSLMARLTYAAVFTVTFLLSFLLLEVSAKLVNITIDDQDGDPTNGNHIIYTPDGAWNIGQNCSACTAKPSPHSDAYLGTWMDSTFNPNGTATTGEIIQASINFDGSAVYVICILTGTSTSPDGNSDMTFILDGSTVGSFEKTPDGNPAYLFNQTVFSMTGLSETSHTLQLQVGLAGAKALVLLDAVIYSKDDGTGDGTTSVTSTGASSSSAAQVASDGTSPTTSPQSDTTITHTSHTGAIAGGAAAAVVTLALLGALLFFLRRRRQRTQVSPRMSLDGGGHGLAPDLMMSTAANNVTPSAGTMYSPVPNGEAGVGAGGISIGGASSASYFPTHTNAASSFSVVSYNPYSLYTASAAPSDPFATPSSVGAAQSHASSTSGAASGYGYGVGAGGVGYYADGITGAIGASATSSSTRKLPTNPRPPLPRGGASQSASGSSSSYAASEVDAGTMSISPPAYSSIEGFVGRGAGADEDDIEPGDVRTGASGAARAAGASGKRGLSRVDMRPEGIRMRVVNEGDDEVGHMGSAPTVVGPDRKS